MTKCKYCGCSTGSNAETCPNCRGKLKLIRQLLGMVKDAKAKDERVKRIQEDLKAVRKNG
jgi:hypothetical protein